MSEMWVALAPLIDPMRAWIRTHADVTVSFAQAPGREPSQAKPPFTVLSIVSDPRLLLTMDGSVPVEVTWQLDHMGEIPLQALGLFDKADEAMVLADPPTLPGATVDIRESVGDTNGPNRVADKRWIIQARYRWRLIPAVSE